MAPKSALRELISGNPGSKTYLDVDDRHASSTGMVENACDPSQKSIFGLSRVDRNDAGLTIHAQDGRVGWINREIRHIKLL
jgi:hypothetical protein